MVTRIVDAKDWSDYFETLTKALNGKDVRIEVIAQSLGDQVLTPSVQIVGMTYEPKKNTVDISLTGLDHIIHSPKSVSIEEDGDDLIAMEIVDHSNQRHLVTIMPSQTPSAGT